jgi:hypothetical protein
VILPISIGDIPTQAFEFHWSDVSGKAYRSTAPQRTIHVRSLLPTDTTGIDIKDIIGPKSLPVRWWPYVLSAAIVLALIAAWYFHYRRKLSKMEIPVVPPERPSIRPYAN